MKKAAQTRFLISIFVGLTLVLGCTPKEGGGGQSVRVLTYSSLGAKGGFLPEVAESFKQASGCALQIETTLGASEMISILADPKESERIDVVMGVDELLFERIRRSLDLSDLSALKLDSRILPLLSSRLKPGFIPLDYGALSMIYRRSEFKSSESLPSTLQDLLKPSLKKKFILQDPRASSPGMMFFLYSASALKVRDLSPQWLTLAPGWDASYKMFLSKEAPMVWSYLSSLAYHASKGEAGDYGFVDFKEGLPLQVEGMAFPKHQKGRSPCAQAWLDFVLKPSVLGTLSEKQWMLPVYSDVSIPEVFKKIPPVKKAAQIDLSVEALDRLLSGFGKELQGEHF
jgi:thiamine transport system substrate-binding protein